MDYKFIKSFFEGDKEYYVYLDENTGKVYKICDNVQVELTAVEMEALNIDRDTLRIVRTRKSKKFNFKKIAVLVLIGALLYSPIKEYKDDYKYIISTQTVDGDYYYLRRNQDINKTISEEVYYKLPQYFEVLSKLGIKESKMVKIANRLAKMDFSRKNEFEVIRDILDLESDFVARELCSHCGFSPRSYDQVLISNLFTFERDAARRLINGESIDKLIKEYHGVKVTTDDINKEEHDLLQGICVDIAKEYGFEHSIFGDGLNNDIFNNYVRIWVDGYNFYGVLRDDGLHNVTQIIYKNKLEKLVFENGAFLNYSEQNDRFLVYLYANSLLYGPFLDLEVDITDLLYKGTITTVDNIGKQPITTEDLYFYLEDPDYFRYNRIPLLSQLAYLGETGIYLLQEVNLCLKEEVKANKINQALYEEFIDNVITIYEENYPELVDVFKEAALKDKSIDGFTIQLINPEI